MVSTKQTGEGKKSIGNGEAKELICTSHAHELSGGDTGGRRVGVQGRGGERGEKKWNNYNSIINKIYLKMKK